MARESHVDGGFDEKDRPLDPAASRTSQAPDHNPYAKKFHHLSLSA